MASIADFPITHSLVNGENIDWIVSEENITSFLLEIESDLNPYKSAFEIIIGGLSYNINDNFKDVTFYDQLIANCAISGGTV